MHRNGSGKILVSPSVVSYLIREQFYSFYPPQRSMEDFLPKKLVNTFYMLGIKEWNLDSLMYRYLWSPVKWVGNQLNFMTLNWLLIVLVPFYLIGLFCLYNREDIPKSVLNCLPVLFSLTAVIMVLKSFTERKRARVAWLLTIMNHFFVVLAISFNEAFNFTTQGLLYLSGVFVAGTVGFVCLSRLKSIEKSLNLQQFYGYSQKHPTLAFVFLLSCLGVSAFPITPTFIGEDLMFTHIHENQAVLAFFTSLSFIIDGLAIMRIYARIYLGPYQKSMYEMAYRSY